MKELQGRLIYSRKREQSQLSSSIGREMGISGNWADLPIEILDKMSEKLRDIDDLIRFGGVCRSWRCASVKSKKTNNKSFGPWLMLSEPQHSDNFLDEETFMLITMFAQEEDESNKNVSPGNEDKDKDDVPPPRKFFNVSTKKTIEIYLPEAQGMICFGSKFGWILTLGEDLNIHLLNPLTRQQISLPPQPTFEKHRSSYDDVEYVPELSIEKFALSTHPKHLQECVVMVICCNGEALAFAKPGDRAWTNVDCPRGMYQDVIFFNNLFYAVMHGGDVVVCDITNPNPVATVLIFPPLRPAHEFYDLSLVEMSRHLHMVVRVYDYSDFTANFEVYKLNFRKKKWIKLRGLGDHALFTGGDESFAISTSDHPELQSNCIYFNSAYSEEYNVCRCDMGIYNFLEKKIIDPLYSGDCVSSTFCSPLFFIPSLY